MNAGERERQGSHHVSEAVIRRRFHGGLVNFETIDRHCTDYWQVFNASGRGLILEAAGETADEEH